MEKKVPTSKDMELIVSRRQLTVLFLRIESSDRWTSIESTPCGCSAIWRSRKIGWRTSSHYCRRTCRSREAASTTSWTIAARSWRKSWPRRRTGSRSWKRRKRTESDWWKSRTERWRRSRRSISDWIASWCGRRVEIMWTARGGSER